METVYPRKKENPRGFLDTVVGDAKRQVESKRVEEVISSGNVEADLRKALEVCYYTFCYCFVGSNLPKDRENTNFPVNMPLGDRTFDLVLLSNWEDQIVYEHNNNLSAPPTTQENNLTTPINKSLESGSWTQSIIWSPQAPFRDFTQLEFNHEDDIIPEERPVETVRPRKRLRTDGGQVKDKFNLSNDHFYEVAKDGGKHRVRQTFGQLVVEHAYPAQKLQLPFVRGQLCLLYCLSHEHASTKPGCQSKKLDLSIVPLFNFPRISNCDFRKCGLRRRKKTRLVGNSAKVVMLARVYGGPAISVFGTRPISFYGNIRCVVLLLLVFGTLYRYYRKSILLLFLISVWEVSLSITIVRRTKKMSMFPRSDCSYLIVYQFMSVY